MRIGRTLPPAAAPIYWRDILSGLNGLLRGEVELDRFEAELKEHFGMKHCFLVSSGKTALTLILVALKEMHAERDEVLIPAFTCYSVPSAIVRAGLRVRLCDIDPNTLDFNFDQLSQIFCKKTSELSAISYEQSTKTSPKGHELNPKNSVNPSNTRNSDRLLAIVPAHLFGFPANIERLRELTGDMEIAIVEDAAQSMGAHWHDRKLGTLGDVAFFSLGRGKALSTGEGGIILTNRDDIAGKIKLQLEKIPLYKMIELVKFALSALALALFVRPSVFWLPKSIPFLRLGETIYDPGFKMRRMSSFQAGMAKDWQNRLKEFKRHRVENSKHWASIIETSFLQSCVSQNGNYPDLIRFPVMTDNEEGVRDRLLKKADHIGVGIMPAYPDCIAGIEEISASFRGETFPAAKKVANGLITLPIHSFVSEKDRRKIEKLIYEVKSQTQKVHFQQEPGCRERI